MTRFNQDQAENRDAGGGGAPPLRFFLGIGMVFAALVVAGLATRRAGVALDLPRDSLAAFTVRAALTAGLVIPVVVASRWLLDGWLRDRRPWSSLGLTPPRRGWRPLLLGAGLWLAPTAVLLAGAALFGWTRIDAPVPPGELALLVLAPVPLAFTAKLAEELAFRGYLQRGCTARWGIWPGVLAQAALFALWGWAVSGSAGQIANLFLLGILLGVLRNYTGNLWVGVGMGTAIAATSQALAAAGADATGGPAVYWAAYAFVPYVTVLVAVLMRPQWFMDGPSPTGTPSPADLLSQTPSTPRPAGLVQKGILYDVGSSYVPGQSSRTVWRPDVVRREIQVIRDELHCTAVTIFGHDTARLEECAEIALEHGLAVWIQPRWVGSTQDEMLAHLTETAKLAERLRQRHSDVGLNVGCELTVFTSGCVPGRTWARRAAVLQFLPLLPLYSWRLNRLLERAVTAARAHFDGQLTYGAGSWENVDWRRFDVIGLDYYWDLTTHANYLDGLRGFRAYGKPIIVAEFGCCSYDGAELRGGGGAEIMDWSDLADRRVRPGHTRNEQVQAEYVGSLIEVYEAEEVYGAFVCMFVEGDCTYSPDPRRDLDMASFGVVRPYPVDSGRSADEGHWERKAAFHEIARRYGG